ncbi:LysR family transcriptional regulator [Streptomyces sp. Tue6028]|uniref:LysR family transcriptional regulator n=1 Tax=Streptomyces sp. Tue6028 TaxID=2036037 RepID=UPI003D72DC7D
MLDVHRLVVLRSVVETGSIQAAASLLGYTPSAISQHIAALQRETGTTLFERQGRGIRATEAGRLLASHARQIQTQIAGAETALSDLRAGKSRRLTIRYFATAGAVLIPPIIAEFVNRFPEVRVELRLGKGLTSEPADMEIMVLDDGIQVPAGLHAIHLLDDPFLAVLPPDHPLAAEKTIELGRLGAETWIDNEWPSSICRETILHACGAAGFSPNFVVEAHDYATAVAFVATGLGVTMVPQLALTVIPTTAVACLPVTRPSATRSIYAVVKETTENHPTMSVFLHLLRTVAASHASGAAEWESGREAVSERSCKSVM